VLLILLAACTRSPPPPDTLLVVLDTVRADHLSAYGHARTQPAFDTLAGMGMVYDNAHASSWTWPSHASLFTGEPAWVHGAHFTTGDGVPLNAGEFSASPMDPALPTLAERYSAAGYRTVALSGNHLLVPELGLTRGFETVEVFDDDAKTLARAQELLAEPDERPLFLFVNLYSAHSPWFINEWTVDRRGPLMDAGWAEGSVLEDGGLLHPQRRPTPGDPTLAERYVSGTLEIPPEGKQLIADLYDGEVLRADLHLGGLLEAWGTRGGVIAVTSDHGEYLGERGLMMHCRTLYPEVTHIPLVLVAPGVAPGRSDALMTLDDLHHTLLSLAGIAPGPAPRTEIKLAAWQERYWGERIGGRFDQGYRLLRQSDWLAIAGTERGVELYDLAADPALNTDVSALHPDRAQAMREQLVNEIPMPDGATVAPLDPALLQHLEQMGYLER
jgi:arylsulfatase A-like enzyme